MTDCLGVDVSNRTCSVPDCERKHAAKGFCQLHWNRNRIHGDPLVTMKGKAHKVKYDDAGMRVCKACGEGKPLTEYHVDKGGTDGYRAQCKPCRGAYMASYHQENREARADYIRERRINNGDHVRALDMARYERHKDKRIALASENVRIRRARLKNTEVDPNVTVSNLRKLHGDSCCYCNIEMDFNRGTRGNGIAPNRATLEHIMPLSRGGTHTFSNTALACHHCNVTKNNKTVEEWGRHKAWQPTVRQQQSGAEFAIKSEPKHASVG